MTASAAGLPNDTSLRGDSLDINDLLGSFGNSAIGTAPWPGRTSDRA
jgi:hypothetical protein